MPSLIGGAGAQTNHKYHYHTYVLAEYLAIDIVLKGRKRVRLASKNTRAKVELLASKGRKLAQLSSRTNAPLG